MRRPSREEFLQGVNASVERAVEVFFLINFAVIGISHVVAPRAWSDWFQRLHAKGTAGVFDYAFICLSFGSIIAALHPVWQGLPLVVTLIGCSQVGKGALYFTVPGFGLKQIGRMSPERAHLFRWAGGLFLILSGVLAWHLGGRR